MLGVGLIGRGFKAKGSWIQVRGSESSSGRKHAPLEWADLPSGGLPGYGYRNPPKAVPAIGIPAQ